MVDITAKLFWYRSKEWYGIMADKAKEIVYTDESKESLDVINLLLLGWILLGLVIYILGNVIATYLRKQKSSSSPVAPKSETAADENSTIPTGQDVSCAETSGEELFQERTQVPKKIFGIPTCEGDDPEIVEWINNVFSWVYNQRVVSPVIDAWLTALNARTRLSSTEHGILVDFKDLLHTSGPPEITQVRQSWSNRSDANVNCQLDFEDLAFEVAVTQFKEKDKVIVPFILNVKRLSGVVNVDCNAEDLTFVAKFSETPQIQSSSEAAKNAEISPEECQPLSDLVCEITGEALSSAIVPLRFSCFPACPRLPLRTGSEDDLFEAAESENEKNLLVKIIKATNLGGSKGCVRPYCVVEMDEPPQKFETQVVEGTQSPFWDESFTFSVKDSADLLFEIYDKDKPSKEGFLGLGIVGMDELLKNPSQRQIIPLQSRPLEDDDVTGSLTAEFLFLNQSSPVSSTTHLAQLSPKGGENKTVETNSRVTAGGTVITTTTIKRTKEEPNGRMEPPLIPLIANPNSAERNPMHAGKKKLVAPVIVANGSRSHKVVSPSNGHVPSKAHGPPIENQIQRTSLENKMQELPVENGIQYSSNKIEMQELLIENKMAESPIENKKQESPIENKMQESPIENKMQESPIENKTQESSIESKMTESINENKMTESINENKMTETFIINEMAESPIENKIVEPNTDNKTLEIESKCEAENREAESCDHNTVACVHVPIPAIVVEAPLENGSVINKAKGTNELENVSGNTDPGDSEAKPNGVANHKDAEADLPGTALKELGKHSSPNATSKSTLIIHSVQRPDSGASGSLDASPASHPSKDSHSESIPSTPSQDRSERSRPKEKKSLMGSLRRRLSFHKNRSKSAENRYETGSEFSSRSASTDRIQKLSPFKGRFLGGSTRSSLSEASGISGASGRTYINENSTLIIETNENGIIKRYLIPNSLAHRSKWNKKRGIKLHVFNDHVFVAKHLSGSNMCQVCQKYLTRRPGKQGYECRGCNLQCHKSCHVKVEDYCSNSTINSMEVEYVHDPKGASPKSI